MSRLETRDIIGVPDIQSVGGLFLAQE